MEQVVDHEAPGEQGDDASDLVADDRAYSCADRRPGCYAGDRAEPEQLDVAAGQCEGMPRSSGSRSDRPAESLADDAESGARECGGEEFGGEQAWARRRE